MSRKLAIKKLKASDLSFFQAYLSRNPQAKQKGFNLDRKIIETALFPALTDVINATPDKRAPVALTLFGPGGASSHLLMRKILKQEKNWRLNGETIYSPDEEPDRYDALAPEDIAVMEFSGASAPDAVKVVLLCASHPDDMTTHAAFATTFPGPSMTLLSEEVMEQVIRLGVPPTDHPIRDWLDKDLLEDVGLGGDEAIERITTKRRGRGLSASDLQKAKANAEAVGELGEVLLDYHYTSMQPHRRIASHEWVAKANAISPYDFLLTQHDDSLRHVDAKSTAGPFKNPIHLSLNEIRHALSSGVPYHLCRLYNVKETGATFRVARNIAGPLLPIADVLSALPTGVKVDSLSFRPEFFEFSERETVIEYDKDADGE